MSKKKLTLRGLFSNTRFVALFSIVVAFVFWIVVALEYAPVIENAVEAVPVKINLENSVPDKLGLQIFGESEFTVDVTVKGSRYIVGGNLISADDFEVTAQTAYVNSAGNHNLPLKVTTKDTDADYEIIGLSADYIDVFFDTYEEKEIEVTPRIISEDGVVEKEYSFDENDIILTHQKVTLTGAKTEIDRINNVYADIVIEDRLSQSTTLDATLSFDTNDISHVSVKEEPEMKMPVTLPVYKVQTLNTSIAFKNAPTSLLNKLPSYTISPESVKVAVLQNGTEETTSLEVGTLDFNKLTTGEQSFTFKSNEIKDVKVLDGTKEFKAEVNVEGYSLKSITIDENSILVGGTTNQNLDIDYSAVGEITIVGASDSLAKLDTSSVAAKIDLSDIKLTSEYQNVPMTVYLKNSDDCWIYGEYFARIKTK